MENRMESRAEAGISRVGASQRRKGQYKVIAGVFQGLQERGDHGGRGKIEISLGSS